MVVIPLRESPRVIETAGAPAHTAAGADLSDVVRVGVFVRRLRRDRPVFDKTRVRHVGEHRPARMTAIVGDALAALDAVGDFLRRYAA
jgi:enamine deaminase RidA (YjgF/YER057c/UK114 family)